MVFIISLQRPKLRQLALMKTTLEKYLTTGFKADMIAYLKSHPEDFDEAITLALSDRQPYSWRAAWLLWSCMEPNDERIASRINDIIEAIPRVQSNQQRDLFTILINMELDEDQEGFVFDLSVETWKRINAQPSVRYSAFRLMNKIVNKYPDLLNEVEVLTNKQYTETLSPGVKRAIIKLIAEIKDRHSLL